MRRLPPLAYLGCWLGLIALAHCRVDEHPNHCKRDADCAAEEQCYRGFCVAADMGHADREEPVSSPSSEAGPAAAADSGTPLKPSTAADSGTKRDSSQAAPASTKDEDAGAPAECQAALPCYDGPPATLGVGECRPGLRECDAGKLGPCIGGQLPQPETCANEGEDNDCNGIRDDIAQLGKACQLDVLEPSCRSGALRCVKGEQELRCAAKSVADETCNGKDDDCDGAIDEKLNLQTDPAHCGACDHACAPGQICSAGVCASRVPNCGSGGPCPSGSPCCDGECVDLRYDSRHCGACGLACGNGETCCDGECVDTRSHLEHCGACGVSCQGTLPGCCNGTCKDLAHNDNNCGGCGIECGFLYGGLFCSCQQWNGRPRCVGLLPGLCL